MLSIMKKILYSVLAVVALLVADIASAQSRTSYFMEGSYFRTELNPALTPTRGYLALPFIGGLGVNWNSNYLSVDNFIYRKNNQLVTALNGAVSPSEFLNRLPNTGIIHTKEDINLLSFGFYTQCGKKSVYWTFGLGLHLNAVNTMSKDLFTVLKTLGNGEYDLGDTYAEATVHSDVYLGAAFPITDWLTMGTRAKFILGMFNAGADFNHLAANVGTDGIDGKLHGDWRANGVLFRNEYIKDGKYTGPMDVTPDTINLFLDNVKSYGFAVDLGLEARLFDDTLKLSAGVVDLGFIRWANVTHIGGQVDGYFTFKGVDVETSEPMEPVGGIDTDNIFGLEKYNGYTTSLACSLNVGAEYNILNNHIAFGLLSHTQFLSKAAYSDLTVSANFRPMNWLTLTLSHTFLNHNRPGVFGAALNFHPAGLNLYIGLDYIDTNLVTYTNEAFAEGALGRTLYIPRYAKSLNLNFGLGFNFGRPKHLKEAEN